MTRDPNTDPQPDEVARGRDALHELGSEPLPADVLARLDGRLEGELGRRAPVRRRRRLPRLAFALPGVGIAVAAGVVVLVLATGSGSPQPAPEASTSLQARAATPLAPKASLGGAAADSGASSKTFALQVRVPALVGHGLGYVQRTTRADRLRWAFVGPTACRSEPGVRVRRQLPKAGAVVPAGTVVHVSIGPCSGSDAG